MEIVKQMIQEAKLTQAIEYIEQLLRDDPLNPDLKSTLIELLCISGEYERADKQLNLIVQKHPDFLIGASNLRQLLRAAQSRQDSLTGQSVPKLFSEVDGHSEAFMKLRVELNQGQPEQVSQGAIALEQARPAIAININDQPNQEVRDLDDTLGGFVEIFGTDGHYYIAQLSEIDYIHFKPVSSLVEQVWRRVDIAIKNGPCGEAHIPVVYATSETDSQKLGRETDWHESATDVMTGRGMKMWFVDNAALPLSAISKLSAAA
ncbi:type VI secretion system accessory protein TagJ [Shewanella waksmanii]|uniref:type VI secretion system accessory protein TagJ n=1 Tax=Shewanella waksmanii TaxID=213783 RepID=UPI00048BB59B|nr:type VI secretion system accessory protein TagJ [Shewanella waksmanii]